VNAGLVWLLRNQPRAFLRSLTRKGRGGKRWLMIAGVALVVPAILAGQLPLWLDRMEDPEGAVAAVERARDVAPLILLAMLVLIDLSGRGLYFRPAEIDFLFPAPVPRRDLLLFQVLTRAGLSGLSGLWTGIFVVRWAGMVAWGFVATALAMVFLQLASQIGSLVLAALGEKGPRVRAIAWSAVAVLAALGAYGAYASVPSDATGGDAFVSFARSPFVLAATLPAQPFARLFTATGWGEAALWCAACLGLLGAMFAVVMRLDVSYEEAALAASRRVQERLRRMRSGEGAFLPSSDRARRRRLPAFPRLGGAGPLARRQFLELVRNPGSVLWTAGSLLVCSGIILAVGAREGGGSGGAIGAAAAAIVLTTFANQGFTFDFRRDLDRMAELKLLPLRPAAVAAGQLVAPTVVFTLIQALVLALVVASGAVPAWGLPVAVAVLLPWNWLSAAIDNALFLVLPYRIAPEDPAKVPFFGRMMLTMMCKTVAVGVVAFVVALPVVAGVAVGGAAAVAGIVGAWLVLAAAAAAATFAVGAVFRHYDAARDV
jgi:hypothetical protein